MDGQGLDAAAHGPLAHLYRPTYLLLPYLTSRPYLDLPPKHQSAWIVNLQPPQKSIAAGSPSLRDGDRPLPAISLSSSYLGRRAPGLRPQVWHFAHSAAFPSDPLEPVEPKLAKPTVAWAEATPNLAQTHNSYPSTGAASRGHLRRQ